LRNRRQMKILFVLEYYPPHIGGAEILFKNLCEGLVARDHKVIVVTSKLKDTRDFEVTNGVTIHRVKVPQEGARYWFTFLSIPKVFKLAKDADLIHTTTYNGAFPAWLASKLRRKTCMITVLEIFGTRWKGLAGMSWLSAKVHQLSEHLVMALPFDGYVSISKYTSECVRNFGVDQEKAGVIYCGIDYDLFDAEKADGEAVRRKLKLEHEFVYLYYGRPGISKGVEYLVEAVPLIAQKIPNSRLLLLLAHDPKNGYENIKRMVDKLKIKDNVILLAPVPRKELPGYIAAADCVVVPSLSEGFGFSAAEACAMGKPVVASNVASLPEVVSGRFILIEPQNPEAIAIGVKSVYNNELRDSGKKVFSWDECVDKYQEVYNELANIRINGGKGELKE
jgi:D-inositol-3-phosphate glycosyltransferase